MGANDITVPNKGRWVRRMIGVCLTLFFCTAILVCVICDLAITKRFSWSLYPISSIVFVWLVLMPAVIWQRKGIVLSLISCSILILPFLYVLEQLVGNTDMILKIGLKVCSIAIPYLWIVFILFHFMNGKLMAAAVSFLIAIPVFLLINYRVNVFLNQPPLDVWDLITLVPMVLMTVVFFCIAWMHRGKAL